MERFRDPPLRDSEDAKWAMAEAGVVGDLNGVLIRCGGF